VHMHRLANDSLRKRVGLTSKLIWRFSQNHLNPVNPV
jgi:hypothetical protein